LKVILQPTSDLSRARDRIELLFPENMPEELQESIEKIIKESPEPALPNMILQLHEERLRTH